jgi:hypothetical protein
MRATEDRNYDAPMLGRHNGIDRTAEFRQLFYLQWLGPMSRNKARSLFIMFDSWTVSLAVHNL